MAIQARNSEMVSLLSADFIQKQDSAYLAGIVAGSILTLPGLVAFWPGQVALNDNLIPLGLSSAYNVATERLGIGTATPARQFQIVSSGTEAAMNLTTNATGSAATDGLYLGYNGAGYLWNYENTDLNFATNNALAATLAPGGHLTLQGRAGEAWTALTLNSGGNWANYGAPYMDGAYKKFGDIIMVRGTVKRTSGSDALIATLPAGYRPTGYGFFPSIGDNVIAGIEIRSDGSIRLGAGTALTYVALDGITFSTV